MVKIHKALTKVTNRMKIQTFARSRAVQEPGKQSNTVLRFIVFILS